MMKKILMGLLLMATATLAEAGDYVQYYTNLPVEMQRVTPPQIPDRELSLTEVGGVGDGVTLCTEAFQRGISRLVKQGGGRLTVPAGIWLTGSIMLTDNIELHLERNAIIVMSPDKRLFLDEQGQRCLPGIRASKRHDIAITGEGIIDGNGEHWRPVKRGKVSDVEWSQYKKVIGGVERDGGRLFYPWDEQSGWPNVADTPEAQEKLRNDLIRLTDCENVLIKGVTVQHSPRFHVHPCFCRNVIIDGVTVRCPWNAQNGDAIDFSDVNTGLIVNCIVDAGDDGLCMKSGKARAGAPANGCKDILVQDNTVFHAHGGFVFGSETVSGMERIVVRQCRFSGTDTGLRFKSGVGRGGRTSQVFISDIVMTDIKDEAVIFQCDYVDRPAGKKAAPTQAVSAPELVPDFQDIHISGITCRGCHTAIKARGIADMQCVHDISIDRSSFIYNKVATDIDEKTTSLTLDSVRLVAR